MTAQPGIAAGWQISAVPSFHRLTRKFAGNVLANWRRPRAGSSPRVPFTLDRAAAPEPDCRERGEHERTSVSAEGPAAKVHRGPRGLAPGTVGAAHPHVPRDLDLPRTVGGDRAGRVGTRG